MRGRVDLIINGSYWLGAALGAVGSLLLLSDVFAVDVGWRLAFALGALLGLAILLVRRNVPESPRWLFIHGHEDEAERIVDRIEADVREETGSELEDPGDSITVRQRKSISFLPDRVRDLPDGDPRARDRVHLRDGTAVGGITGSFLFGKMIETGEESQVAIAFFIGAAVMAVGGVVELFLGVRAEKAQLEDIAKPLTAQEAEAEAGGPERERPAAPERRRRRRLGPGQTGYSPGMAVSAPIAAVALEREVDAIERAVAGRGPTERRELARAVGARFWGRGGSRPRSRRRSRPGVCGGCRGRGSNRRVRRTSTAAGEEGGGAGGRG